MPRLSATPHIGREAELQRIDALFEEGARLVCVTGAPGIGKTRMAQEYLAHSQQSPDSLHGEMHFCDISGARTLEEVVACVASAMEVPLERGGIEENSSMLLGRAMAARPDLLLILDNYEQVASLAVETLSLWMDTAPLACFLITSRQRLRLREERVVTLAPLEVELAVHLFESSARRIHGDFVASPHEEAAIEEIVRRLEGIPLAIELAAARSSVMSPTQMLERLDRPLDLLRQGLSDSSERQSTLRKAIDWSWALLSEAETCALAQCAVFRAGFSLEDAEAVVDTSDVVGAPLTMDLVDDLCSKSLLRSWRPEEQPDALRFAPYESVREYAREKCISSGQHAPALERLGHHLAAGAERRTGPLGSSVPHDLRWFALNRENLLSAHNSSLEHNPPIAARIATCLAHLTLWQGPFDAIVPLLDNTLEALSTEERGRFAAPLLLARGVAHSKLGQHKDAEEDLRAALASAEIPLDVTLEAMVRLHEGLSLLRRGLVPECQECLEAATLLVEAAGVADKHPRLTLSLGACHETLGDFEAAELLYKKALQQAESNQNQRDAARIHSKMGTLCGFQSGREAESREHLELARTVGRDLGERIIEASATYNLGRLAMNQNQREEAHQELSLALSQFQEMGDLSSEGMVALSLGLVLLEDGDLTSARARIGEAERALSVAGSALSWIYAQATLALADLVAEDTTSAQIRAEMAAKRAEELEHDILKGICVCVLCFVSALGGDPAGCADYADEANRCLDQSSWAEGVALNALVSHFRALSVAVEEQERLGSVSEAVLLSLQAVAREIAAPQAALPARARVTTRLLGRALGDLTGQAPAMPPVQTVHALQVEREGRWFHAPDTKRVDISRRRTLRPLLVRLVKQRLDHPGEALSIDDLFCAAWPGERILEEAKKNRVYVAVATLRRAGLDRYIDTRSDGYLLRQDVEVNWAAD